MIKINLLRNRGGSGAQTSATKVSYDTTFDDGSTAPGNKVLFLKIIIMSAGVTMLMLYEYYNIDELQSKLRDMNFKKNAAAQELERSKPIASSARELQTKILDLEARIQVIKDLSKVRLREIKSIDYIQNVIPERVWLSSLEFNNNNLKIDGSAVSDDQLSRFMEAIDGKFYFRNVILLKAVEEKEKTGTVKVFKISSDLITSE